ncbi:zinc finger protein 420, partial [Danaus plexippus plexippus]
MITENCVSCMPLAFVR